MISVRSPEDIRAMLLHMAAASAGERTQRARMARWFRDALEILEHEDEPHAEAPPTITPAVKTALVEMATALTMAAEHADFLAEECGLMRRPHRRAPEPLVRAADARGRSRPG